MNNRSLINSFEEEFAKTKRLADRAVAQLDDVQLHVKINARQNSVAAIMQHVAKSHKRDITAYVSCDVPLSVLT